uniref:Uncharacterized protein n=1 Tax=Tetraselmis chuii TaxID=63592 RepID=A0A7S1X3P6_9CHLO
MATDVDMEGEPLQESEVASKLVLGTKVELMASETSWISGHKLIGLDEETGTARLQQTEPSERSENLETATQISKLRPAPPVSAPSPTPGTLLEIGFPDLDSAARGSVVEWRLCLVLSHHAISTPLGASPPLFELPEGTSPLLQRLHRQGSRQPGGDASLNQRVLKLYYFESGKVNKLSGEALASTALRQAMAWDTQTGDWKLRTMSNTSVPRISAEIAKQLLAHKDAEVCRRLRAKLSALMAEGCAKAEAMPVVLEFFMQIASRTPLSSRFPGVRKFFKQNEWQLSDGLQDNDLSYNRRDRSGSAYGGGRNAQKSTAGLKRKQRELPANPQTPTDADAERRKSKVAALEEKKAKAAKLKDQGRIIAQSCQTPVNAPGDGVPLFDNMENSPLVLSSLASHFKMHQWDGIRFIWENLVMEHDGVAGKEDESVGGCILAHSMGLGKTLQTITFLSMFHNQHPNTQSLVVLPANVLANWKQEFKHWVGEGKGVKAYPLFKSGAEIAPQVREWSQQPGGVLMITYNKLAALMLKKEAETTETEREIQQLLIDTPSVVVADEAHELRTRTSNKHKAIQLIKTKRRLALTGYPLQNNLNEYYVMICWVRPDYLGDPEEFRKEFAEPINNGQGSWDADARTAMLDRLSVLDDFTSHFIQRKGINFLEEELVKTSVQKNEHVLLMRLSDIQEKMYQTYLGMILSRQLLRDSEHLRKICNSPEVFIQLLKAACTTASQGADWVADDYCDLTLDEPESETTTEGADKKQTIPAKIARQLLDIVKEAGDPKELDNPKFELLDIMLADSRQRKEQLVIFSESVSVLNSLQSHMTKKGWQMASGQQDPKDDGALYYLRLDGNTPSQKRQRDVNCFRKHSKSILVYLMSTKAGSLGINLTSASRMAILDCPWNPVHNAQAVARIFRLGQNRSVKIYRMMYENTMEHMIYKCTLVKESLAYSVVDRRPTIPQSKENEMYKYTVPIPMDPHSLQKAALDTKDQLLVSAISNSSSVMGLQNHQALLAADTENPLEKHDRLGAATRYLRQFEEKAEGNSEAQLGQSIRRNPKRLLRLRKASLPTSRV